MNKNTPNTEEFEKLMDRLGNTTKFSFVFLIPAVFYSVNSQFNIGTFEGKIAMGGVSLTPIAGAYVILFFTCLLTTILVNQLYHLKSEICKVQNGLEKVESVIRNHHWWINPFSLMVSDAPAILKIFYNFLRPAIFYIYLVLLHSPIFMISTLETKGNILYYVFLIWLCFVWWFAYMGVEKVEKSISKCNTKWQGGGHIARAVILMGAAYFGCSYAFQNALDGIAPMEGEQQQEVKKPIQDSSAQ